MASEVYDAAAWVANWGEAELAVLRAAAVQQRDSSDFIVAVACTELCKRVDE